MPQTNIAGAIASDMTNRIADITVATKLTDGVGDQEETEWVNTDWSKWWGYFNAIADLQSALLMKSIWNVGKGFIADEYVTATLDNIYGWGKDTFEDILFNMDVIRNIGGDSFAEIIRDEDSGMLINLKPLDPASMKIIVGRNGMIKRYEQISKTKGVPKKFEPKDIFHLCCNRLADQIHGISKIAAIEKTILADNENFIDMKKLMHHQVRPFFIWKLKTDDPVKIAAFVTKIDAARNLGEDCFIPDDDEAVSFERVEINISDAVFRWREDIRNKFYRHFGMPLIIFGSGGSTESGGKMEYYAHEQVFEHDQKYLEKQIWNQLELKINLIPPQSMAQNLTTDEQKDMSESGMPQGLEMQQGDLTPGAGE